MIRRTVGSGFASDGLWVKGRLPFLLLVLATAPAGTGCKTSCTVDADPNPEVITSGVAEGGVYESSPWNGEYHEFPPQKRYEFRHGLGGVPKEVATYVAFEETPIGTREFGNVAEAAGNIVIIEDVSAEDIRVRNDTCETFYLRVVASGASATQ